MNRLILVLVVLVLAGSAVACSDEAKRSEVPPDTGTPAPEPPSDTIPEKVEKYRRPSLYGTVTQVTSRTELPLAKAEVSLRIEGKRGVATAYSDGKGNYAIWDVPDGNYLLRVLVGGRPVELLVGGERRKEIRLALGGGSMRRNLRVQLAR